MSEPLYQIRKYGEKVGDFQLVDSWMKAHGETFFLETLIPALGIFAIQNDEDVAVAWLYLDNSIGVCFMEHIVTRPGLSPLQAFEALSVVTEFLAAEAKAMNYGWMFVFTSPAIARYAERAGFRRLQDGMVMLGRNLTTE